MSDFVPRFYYEQRERFEQMPVRTTFFRRLCTGLFSLLLAVCLVQPDLVCGQPKENLDKPASGKKDPGEKENKKDSEQGKLVPEKKSTPLSRYVVVKSPVEDVVFRKVRNVALKLQELAITEDRSAFLILEIRSGQSEFHQVHGLAKFLTSSKVDRLTTIAWIPETVTGNNVIVALGCREIVIHPDAEIGDIGRGKAVEPDEEQLVLSIVNKRHNLKINADLALGLLNPDIPLLLATIEQKEGSKEKRVVTQKQLKTLRDNQLSITNVEPIKEQGQRGIFSGAQARELGILVTQTIDTRAEFSDLYGLDPQSLQEALSEEESTVVRLIEVSDTIDPVLEAFIERQIERAKKNNAQIIIFKIKSPGGYLMSGTNLANMIADLEEDIHTVAWIPDHAISSAAITALGCDDIFMGPDGQIGDAGVIVQDFDGAFDRVPEKLLSPLRQTLISLAKRKNRPPALLEAMTFKDLEVFEVTHRETGRIWYMSDAEILESNGEWIKGPMVPESVKDTLLTVRDDRAVKLKIATAVVKDVDELKERLNIPPDVELEPVGRTWVDSLIYILNSPFITGFLLFMAIIFIYFELHFMVGIFGIGSAICFGVFFWSRYLGGTATGLEIVLFLIGIICIFMEIFVIPGFGVFGVSGVLLMLVSLILASETFNSFDSEINTQKLVRVLATLGLPLLAVIASSMLIGKFLPKIPILRHIVLTPPASKHAGDTDSLQLRPDLVDKEGGIYVGKQGVAVTILRPSGKARFNEGLVDVVTEGPFIEENSPIEVIEIRGNRVVVRSLG